MKASKLHTNYYSLVHTVVQPQRIGIVLAAFLLLLPFVCLFCFYSWALFNYYAADGLAVRMFLSLFSFVRNATIPHANKHCNARYIHHILCYGKLYFNDLRIAFLWPVVRILCALREWGVEQFMDMQHIWSNNNNSKAVHFFFSKRSCLQNK